MGVLTSGATRVTDEMFAQAARTLAQCVTEKDLADGCLYPSLTRIIDVSAQIAAITAEVAYTRNLATTPRPKDLLASIKAAQYKPDYPQYA